jgi:hypothetical protein
LAFFLLASITISAQEIGVRFGEVSVNNIAGDGVLKLVLLVEFTLTFLLEMALD